MRSFAMLLSCLCALAKSVEVQTGSGKLVGRTAKFHGLHQNGTYVSFQGIPYATPPVGQLRFKDPVPLEPWSGILNVSGGPPPVCPQKRWGVLAGDEDCLFLNIYTPEVSSLGLQQYSVLRPVVLWIHGGYFTFGNGVSGGPDLFLESDVVFVSINYRLGILGFMAIKGTSIQGNMGLKDQLEALRWIKKNIEKFGGDPTRITIMGGSAGGASVHSHVLSPLGKGVDLFHRAIAMSGTAMVYDPEKSNAFVEWSSRRTYELLCGENLTVTKLRKNLRESCLYDLPAMQFTDQLSDHYLNSFRNITVADSLQLEDNLFFAPILDPWADVPFQPEHPVTVVTCQDQKMVPLMIGVTKNEGALILAPLWKDIKQEDNHLRRNWRQFGPIQFNHVLNKDSVTNDDSLFAEMIARFYVGKDGIKRENKEDLLDMFSDEHLIMPNVEFVKLHAKSPAPVYNYQFSYRGSFSFSSVLSMGDKEAMKEDFGVSHADDKLYMFRFPSIPHLKTNKEVKVAHIFQKLLTNFARYGDPTPFENREIINWPTAQTFPNCCVYLDINENPQARPAMHPVRMKFWNQIYFKSVLEKYANGDICNCKNKYRQARKERRVKQRFIWRCRRGGC